MSLGKAFFEDVNRLNSPRKLFNELGLTPTGTPSGTPIGTPSKFAHFDSDKENMTGSIFEIQKMRVEVNKLKNQLISTVNKSKNLSVKLETETTNSKLATLKSLQLEEEVKSLKQTQQDNSVQFNKEQSKLVAERDGLLAEKEVLSQQILSLQAQCVQAQEEALKSASNEFKKEEPQAQDCNNCEFLTTRTQALSREFEKAANAYSNQKTLCNQLKRNNDTLKAENEELSKSIAQIQQLGDHLQIAIETLNTKYTKEHNAKQKLELQLNLFKVNEENYKQQLHEVTRHNQLIENDNHKFNRKFQELSERHQQLIVGAEETNHQMQEQIDEEKKRSSLFESVIATQRVTIKQITDERNGLKDKLKYVLQQANLSMEELQRRNTKLVQRTKKIREEKEMNREQQNELIGQLRDEIEQQEELIAQLKEETEKEKSKTLEKEASINLYSESVSQLEKKALSLQNENDLLKDQIKRIDNESKDAINSSKAEVNIKDGRIVELESHKNDLSEKVQRFEVEAEALKRELEELTSEKERLNELLDDEILIIDTIITDELVAEVNGLQIRTNDAELVGSQQKEKVVTLESKIQLLQESLVHLEKDREILQKDKELLQKEIETSKSENDSLSGEREKLTEALSSVQNELSIVNQSGNNERERFAQLMNEMKTKEEELVSIVNNNQSEFQRANAYVQQQSERINLLESQKQELTDTVSKLEEEIKVLKEELEEITEEKEKLDEILDDQIITDTFLTDELLTEVEEAERHREDLKVLCENTNSEREKLSQQLEQILLENEGRTNQLKLEIEEKQELYNQLERERDELNRKQIEQIKLLREVSEKNETFESQIEELNQKNNEKDIQIQNYTRGLNQQVEENEMTKKGIEQEMTKLNEEISLKNTQNSQLQKELEEFQLQHEKLVSQLQVQQTEGSKVSSDKYERLEEENDANKQLNFWLVNSNQKLETELNDLKERFNASFNQQQSELNKLREINTKLEKEIDVVKFCYSGPSYDHGLLLELREKYSSLQKEYNLLLEKERLSSINNSNSMDEENFTNGNDELRRQISENSQLKNQITLQSEELNRLMNQMRQFESEVNSRNMELNEKYNAICEQKTQLEKDLEGLRNELKDSVSELDIAKSKIESLKDLESKYEELKQQIVSNESGSGREFIQLKEAQIKIEQLRKELVDSHMKLTMINEDYKSAVEKADHYKKLNEEGELQLVELMKLSSLSTQSHDQSIVSNSISKALQEEQEKYAKQEAEIIIRMEEEKRTELNSKETVINSLKLEIDELVVSLEGLQSKNVELQNLLTISAAAVVAEVEKSKKEEVKEEEEEGEESKVELLKTVQFMKHQHSINTRELDRMKGLVKSRDETISQLKATQDELLEFEHMNHQLKEILSQRDKEMNTVMLKNKKLIQSLSSIQEESSQNKQILVELNDLKRQLEDSILNNKFLFDKNQLQEKEIERLLLVEATKEVGNDQQRRENFLKMKKEINTLKAENSKLQEIQYQQSRRLSTNGPSTSKPTTNTTTSSTSTTRNTLSSRTSLLQKK